MYTSLVGRESTILWFTDNHVNRHGVQVRVLARQQGKQQSVPTVCILQAWPDLYMFLLMGFLRKSQLYTWLHINV